MQESDVIGKMKLEPSYGAECERTLSPIFDMEESHVHRDATSLSSFEEKSRKLKIKVEPDACTPPYQAYTDGIGAKPWPREPPVATSALSNQSTTPAVVLHNDETTRSPSTSLTTPTTTPATLHQSPPMPQLYTQSVITQASTTSQTSTTNQARPLVRPLGSPQFMQNSPKSGSRWNTRQSEVQKIIKQRTKEWKEKQALYQLMRNAAAQNPFLGGSAYQYRGKDPVSFSRGRGKHPGNDLVPRSAFNWYPGFVTPNELTHIRSYPCHVNGYPIMAEFDPKIPGNPTLAPKRRHSSEAGFSDAEKSGCAGKMLQAAHHEPMIKEVVSLADTISLGVDEENVEHRKSKRARRSIDEQTPERRESVDSGNSDPDCDSLNASGKYISDFAQGIQNTPQDHQVAHINGLLSLPSSRETRYGITYGELKRRCGAPEYLTRVDLVAYVRHSKSSGRSLLDKYKVVSANRASRPTIMSKMCENEARVLGDGILRMNMDYFPDKMLVEAATEALKENLKEVEQDDENKEENRKSKIKEKMQNIETTRSMLKEVFDLLHSEKDHEDMQRFELASHTFGTANLKNHLTLFDRFFQEYQTSLMTSIEGSDCDP